MFNKDVKRYTKPNENEEERWAERIKNKNKRNESFEFEDEEKKNIRKTYDRYQIQQMDIRVELMVLVMFSDWNVRAISNTNALAIVFVADSIFGMSQLREKLIVFTIYGFFFVSHVLFSLAINSMNISQHNISSSFD